MSEKVTSGRPCALMLSARQSPPKAVAFYEAAFGAAEDLRLAGPIPVRSWRRGLSIDGGKFWLAEESPEHRNFSPEMLGGGMVRMILNVPDPDASFERPGRRAREVVAVKDDHGWRLGRLGDPFGHHWEIGRPLDVATPGPASRLCYELLQQGDLTGVVGVVLHGPVSMTADRIVLARHDRAELRFRQARDHGERARCRRSRSSCAAAHAASPVSATGGKSPASGDSIGRHSTIRTPTTSTHAAR